MCLYKIVTIADIHWGAINPLRLYSELLYFLEFIKTCPEDLKPDLVVIAGDYFNDKISLNSESANRSFQFFNDLCEVCTARNIMIRIFQGTMFHDHKQLRTLTSKIESKNNIKIFMENTLEETLPGLWCLYCPDETINIKDYYNKYINNIIPPNPINIGFFHGSFDVILPDIVLQETEIESIENVVFEYDKFSTFINGPMIAGHFHNRSVYNHLYYVGSYSRWAFNEDDPKGFMYTIYDTETQEYLCKWIDNPYAETYLTYVIDTMSYTTLDEYQALIKLVNDKIIEMKDEGKIRLKIIVHDDSPEITNFINLIKFSFINNKRIKITVDNKKKLKEKKKKLAENKVEESKYDYLFSSDMTIYQKLQNYILIEYGKEIPLDQIIEFFKAHESELEDKLLNKNGGE